MKICAYCGRENSDEAVQCHECGTAFNQGQESEIVTDSEEWFNQPISTRRKWYLWLAAWGTVILVTLAIKPVYLLTAPAFPVGLVALLSDREAETATAWLLGAPIIAGWSVYALISFVIIKARRKGVFVLAYVVLCILLVLNLGGCQRALETASQIQ